MVKLKFLPYPECKVYDIIMEAGMITRSALLRKTKCNSDDLDKIIARMESVGCLKTILQYGKTKPTIVYVFIPLENRECRSTTNDSIDTVCSELSVFLHYKNNNYGNSALDPIRVFSKSDSESQLFNRMDDKLSRIKNGDELRKNDVVDLMGYLVLLCIKKEWLSFKDLID